MSNYHLVPKCPFCGVKMDFIDTNVSFNDCDVNWKQCWYRCPRCLIPSPMCATEPDAYIAATKRKRESNHVLSISELLNIASKNFNGLLALDQEDVVWLELRDHQSKPLWIERRDSLDSEGYIKIKNWGIIRPSSEAEERKPFPQIYTWVLGHPEIGEAFYAFRYNMHWRCWLREPTEKELKETPWEDEKNVR